MREEEKEKWDKYIAALLAHHKNEEYVNHMKDVVFRILEARVENKSEWRDGFNTGLEWAIRIYLKDKSAY